LLKAQAAKGKASSHEQHQWRDTMIKVREAKELKAAMAGAVSEVVR
jgi:hypothetical protein